MTRHRNRTDRLLPAAPGHLPARKTPQRAGFSPSLGSGVQPPSPGGCTSRPERRGLLWRAGGAVEGPFLFVPRALGSFADPEPTAGAGGLLRKA